MTDPLVKPFHKDLDDPSPHSTTVSLPNTDVDPCLQPRPNQPRPKFLPTLPPITLVLANIGSVARDHLASERTWLSYVRTSLGVAGTGVALVQLFAISVDEHGGPPGPNAAKIQRLARPIGAATVFLGLYILAAGVQRYFCIQHALTQGQFPVARITVISVTVALAVLVAATFGILIAIRPD